jgi:hypothetical protein
LIGLWGKDMTMTKRKNHSPEQIVRKLGVADRLIADGATGDEAALTDRGFVGDVVQLAQSLWGDES